MSFNTSVDRSAGRGVGRGDTERDRGETKDTGHGDEGDEEGDENVNYNKNNKNSSNNNHNNHNKNPMKNYPKNSKKPLGNDIFGDENYDHAAFDYSHSEEKGGPAVGKTLALLTVCTAAYQLLCTFRCREVRTFERCNL